MGTLYSLPLRPITCTILFIKIYLISIMGGLRFSFTQSLKITGEASTSLHMPSPLSSLHCIYVIIDDDLRYTTIIPQGGIRAWKESLCCQGNRIKEHAARRAPSVESREHGLDRRTGTRERRAAVRQSSRTARCNWRRRAGSSTASISTILSFLIVKLRRRNRCPCGATRAATAPSTRAVRAP